METPEEKRDETHVEQHGDGDNIVEQPPRPEEQGKEQEPNPAEQGEQESGE